MTPCELMEHLQSGGGSPFSAAKGSTTNDRLIYSRHDAAIRLLRSLQTRDGRSERVSS